MLRKLLVGSAHYVLGPFGSDSDLRRHGEKIASRGGKNSKKRAVVAVARKLSVLLHRLWVTGRSTTRSTTPIGAKSRRLLKEARRAEEQRGGEVTGTAAGEPKAADGHGCSRPNALRISSVRRLRNANLVHPPGRPIGRLQRL